MFKGTVICYVMLTTSCSCPKKCDGSVRGWERLADERKKERGYAGQMFGLKSSL